MVTFDNDLSFYQVIDSFTETVEYIIHVNEFKCNGNGSNA